MKNPLSSEAAAFRLLLGVIVFLAAIVAASLAGGPWAGLAVFVALSAGTLAWLVRGSRREPRE